MQRPKCCKPKMHLGQPEVALAVTAAQWDWLADNPSHDSSLWKAKLRWPGFNYWHNVAANCAICEYGLKQVALHGEQSCSNTKCMYCLIPIWKSPKRSPSLMKCCRNESPYLKWCATRSKEAALAIRDMALTELARRYQHRLTVKFVLYSSLEEFFKPTTACGAKLQPHYNIYAPNRAVNGTYYFGYSPQVIVSPHNSPPLAFLCLTSQQYIIAKRQLPITHFIEDRSVEEALNFWNTSTLKRVNNIGERTVVFKEFFPILPMTKENYYRWVEICRKVSKCI